MNEWIWPNNYVGGTYQNEVNYLKDWFEERVAWMDKNIDEISWQVKNSSSEPTFKLYPNPFHNELTIQIQKETRGAGTLTFFNFVGQKITTLNFDIKNGTANELKIPTHTISQLSSGIYYYVFEINGQQIDSGQLMKD